MRLTIIPSDKTVYVDGVPYSPLEWEGTPADVHALQWHDVAGHIELIGNLPNVDITELPTWATNAYNAWVVANTPVPYVRTAADNQAIASSLLYETDWTTIPDVTDPAKSNPYLSNSSDFITYRNQVRQIAINPIAGDITFPTKPSPIWEAGNV